MSELKNGNIIALENGKSAKIVRELGRGGQGIVYLAEVEGKQFALKWFLKTPSEWFYKNLKYNINRPAPSKAFLWPLAITLRQGGDFGYLMRLRPNGYYELGDYFTANAAFENFNAILRAAINICNGYARLHAEGFSYQDINEGGFFINPTTGDVLICDMDNVSANNSGDGFSGGKPRYMAPEVVNGAYPNSKSDLFSLAIILYRLFMLDHPYEGKRTVAIPALTNEIASNIYGLGAIFTFDSTNAINRPSIIHENAQKRWDWCPPVLKEKFQQALGNESINGLKRIGSLEWKKLFLRLRRELVVCENPLHKTDVDFMYQIGQQDAKCPFCGHSFKLKYSLLFSDTKEEYVLGRHKNVYLGDSDHEILAGYCRVRKSEGRVELGLQNVMQDKIIVTTASGKLKELPPNEVMPLRDGMYIKFSQQFSAKVKVK